MRTGRNETDCALSITAAGVVGANRQQAGKLALAAGIGLQAHCVVTRHFTHHLFELGNQLAVSSRVSGGCMRVDVGKFGPSHRNHFGGGVELHRARPQRNHRAIKGEVFVGQAA